MLQRVVRRASSVSAVAGIGLVVAAGACVPQQAPQLYGFPAASRHAALAGRLCARMFCAATATDGMAVVSTPVCCLRAGQACAGLYPWPGVFIAV